MNEIETLLRERMGLDAATIGTTVVGRAVRLRMKASGVTSAEGYALRLQTNQSEWRQLVEAVVVAETWFFRDRGAFTALAQWVEQDWQPRHPVETLRVLSLPCSSGEEPLSVAMTLTDAGFDSTRLIIDAVDISHAALARARQAVYGKNSFRGHDLAYRDRYFTAAKGGFSLSPTIRRKVRFFQGNLLGQNAEVAPPTPDLWPPTSGPYDVIFCRNLLIYFDRATQTRALARLHTLLSDDGCLFVGPAEVPLIREHGFEPVNWPMAFASRKLRGGQSEAAVTARNGQSVSRRVSVETEKRQTDASTQSLMRPVIDSPIASPLPDAFLPEARKLADAGRLVEAVALCERHLKHHGPCADAYYLLGLLKEARGQSSSARRGSSAAGDTGQKDGKSDVQSPALSAAECYRRALYLDPEHYEALVQMSLLLEQAGDRAGAKIFKRRAQRAGKHAGHSPLAPALGPGQKRAGGEHEGGEAEIQHGSSRA